MSTSASAPSVPTGYSPPFTVVTDFDHSAWIIIATALGLACVFIFAAARIVFRYAVTSGFGQDDWLFASSVIFTIIQSSMVLYGCSVGLGTSMVHLSLQEQLQTQKISYAANLFWIISLGLSKISVASLLQRIDAFGRRQAVFTTIAAFIGVWSCASFFALALQCNIAHPWLTFKERCNNEYLRWEVISVFDILTELVLLGASIYLISVVQTSFARKAIIVVGFACRLPIIIAIGFRLGTFDQTGLLEDPSLREALFIVWTQTELYYSIISATIPSLLQFMRNLNTEFGRLTEKETKTYGSHGRSQRSFPMSMLRSARKNSVSHTHSQKVEESEESAVAQGYRATVANGPEITSKDSLRSNDSQRMIIQKEVTYNVAYE